MVDRMEGLYKRSCEILSGKFRKGQRGILQKNEGMREMYKNYIVAHM